MTAARSTAADDKKAESTQEDVIIPKECRWLVDCLAEALESFHPFTKTNQHADPDYQAMLALHERAKKISPGSGELSLSDLEDELISTQDQITKWNTLVDAKGTILTSEKTFKTLNDKKAEIESKIRRKAFLQFHAMVTIISEEFQKQMLHQRDLLELSYLKDDEFHCWRMLGLILRSIDLHFPNVVEPEIAEIAGHLSPPIIRTTTVAQYQFLYAPLLDILDIDFGTPGRPLRQLTEHNTFYGLVMNIGDPALKDVTADDVELFALKIIQATEAYTVHTGNFHEEDCKRIRKDLKSIESYTSQYCITALMTELVRLQGVDEKNAAIVQNKVMKDEVVVAQKIANIYHMRIATGKEEIRAKIKIIEGMTEAQIRFELIFQYILKIYVDKASQYKDYSQILNGSKTHHYFRMIALCLQVVINLYPFTMCLQTAVKQYNPPHNCWKISSRYFFC